MTPMHLVPLAYALLLAAADGAAVNEARVELAALGLVEAWNYNNSRETLSGGEVTLVQPLSGRLSLTVGPYVTYVDQRGIDAYAIAATLGLRRRIWSGARSSIFAGLTVGAFRAEIAVPPHGTRFNYIFRLDAGFARRVPRSDAVIVAGVVYLHLSNNSLAGRDRNPDIQALGVRVGLSMPVAATTAR